jgi:predicted  nucleic acid-binding Zn-ribbon protein
LAISSETLEAERSALKEQLRQIEAEQRRLEGEMKKVRQQELRARREIEALTTLLDLAGDSQDER